MKSNNALRSVFLERTIETALFIGVAVLTGLVGVAFAPTLFSVLAGGGWGYAQTGNLIGILLDRGIILTSVGMVACVFLLLWISKGWGAIPINLVRLQNACLLLIGASLVVPVIPVQIITIFLVLLFSMSLVFSPQGRAVGNGFRLVVGLFIALNIAGIIVSVFQLDDVRHRIPMLRQLVGALPYITAFLVYYGVQRNNWEPPDFEKFFKIIIWGTTVLAVEALCTWYIGRSSLPLPIVGSSLSGGGLFESFWIRNHHGVARIALVSIFGSLYFFARYALKRNLVFAGIASLVLVATLDRAPIIVGVVGVGLFFARGRSHTLVLKAGSASRRILIRGVFSIIALILAGYAANFALQRVTIVRDASVLGEVFQSRLVHHARALDVLAYTPMIGTGPQLDQFYQGSSFVPPTFLNIAVKTFGMSPDWALRRITDEGLQREGASYSAHSLWLEFIMHWGIFGFVTILYLLYWMFKIFVKLLKSRSEVSQAVWAIFLLASGLSASMITTSRFRNWWLFVLLYLFLSRCLEELDRKGEFA
jgi:hypothetical protein